MAIPKYSSLLIVALAVSISVLPGFSQPNGLYEGERGDIICVKGDSIFCRISFPGGLITYHCVVGTFERDENTLKIKHQDFTPLTYELQKQAAPDSLVVFKLVDPQNEGIISSTLFTFEVLTQKRFLKRKKHTFSSFVNQEGEAQFHIGPIFLQSPIKEATLKVRNLSYAVNIPVEPLPGIDYEINKLIPYPYSSSLDKAGETSLHLMDWTYERIRIQFPGLDKVVELTRKGTCHSCFHCIYRN